MTYLENCIFKYGPYDSVERTLTARTLPFSNLDSYNDIYEDEFHLLLYVRRESHQEFNSAAIDVRNVFEGELKKYLVTCFSERADIALMWSHYADKHSGVCYCFDFTQPDPIFETPINRGHVKYSNQLPNISVYQQYTTDTMIRDMVSDVVLTKQMEWAYEKEIRFWYDSTVVGELNFDPLSLKALIVGRRVENDRLAEITRNIESYNTSHGTEVDILYAHRNKETFDLGVCRDKQQRDWNEIAQNNSSVMTVSREGRSLLT